jgi:glycosyltransferase involved in cell wall biosynthesis
MIPVMPLRFLIMSLLRPREALRIARSVLAAGGVVAARAIAERSAKRRNLVYGAMRALGALLTRTGSSGGLIYTAVATVGIGKRGDALAQLEHLKAQPSAERRAAGAAAAALLGERAVWSELTKGAGFSQPAIDQEITASTNQTLAHIATASIYAGELSEGMRLLKALLARPQLSRSMKSVMNRRLSDAVGKLGQYDANWRPAMPEPPVPSTPVAENLVTTLWVNALPEIQSGYTLRSRSVALGLQGAGLRIQAVTAAGFPQGSRRLDRPERRPLGNLDVWRIGGTGTDLSPDELGAATATGLARVIDESGSGVLISTTPYLTAATALAVARSRKRKMIYEVRGFLEETWVSRAGVGADTSELYQRWRDAETRTMRNADAVVTLSDGMRDEIVARGIPGDRVFVVPNGVDVSSFTPQAPDSALSAQLGIPAGVPVLGYIGSLVQYEGIPDLVRAAALLRDQGVDFRLLIVGSGADAGRISSAIQEADLGGLVMMPGRVPHAEVRRYHSLIDLFVVPRTADRVCQLVTPLKPYEAMAMGRCVVASDVAAIRQVVREGETGRLATPENPADLARVLRELIEAPEVRVKLGQTAQEWVRRERSWEAIGAIYADVVRRVTSAPLRSEADR